MDEFMKEAITEAYTGITLKHGGPFGCVIVKDGIVVGRGHNRVLIDNDPTAHGEMVAIRDACKNLGTFDLTGCELYTTAAACPMCNCAIMWANITTVYQGCCLEDTDKIGFRDVDFQTQSPNIVEVDRDACLELFKDYQNISHQMY